MYTCGLQNSNVAIQYYIPGNIMHVPHAFSYLAIRIPQSGKCYILILFLYGYSLYLHRVVHLKILQINHLDKKSGPHGKG